MDPTPRYFDAYADYQDAVLQALASARHTLAIFDPDLGATGMEGPAGSAALERFLAQAVRADSVRVIVRSPTRLERESPRLLALLLRFGHRFSVRVAAASDRSWTRPFLVADGTHLVTRFHEDAPRGKACADDPAAAAGPIAQFETMWITAKPGPTGAPLGI